MKMYYVDWQCSDVDFDCVGKCSLNGFVMSRPLDSSPFSETPVSLRITEEMKAAIDERAFALKLPKQDIMRIAMGVGLKDMKESGKSIEELILADAVAKRGKPPKD